MPIGDFCFLVYPQLTFASKRKGCFSMAPLISFSENQLRKTNLPKRRQNVNEPSEEKSMQSKKFSGHCSFLIFFLRFSRKA